VVRSLPLDQSESCVAVKVRIGINVNSWEVQHLPGPQEGVVESIVKALEAKEDELRRGGIAKQSPNSNCTVLYFNQLAWETSKLRPCSFSSGIIVQKGLVIWHRLILTTSEILWTRVLKSKLFRSVRLLRWRGTLSRLGKGSHDNF